MRRIHPDEPFTDGEPCDYTHPTRAGAEKITRAIATARSKGERR